MELREIFDYLPLPIYLVLVILAMIVLIELGYRGGLQSRKKPDKAQMAQVRAIMELIRANDERVQHTMFNRIPPIIWITLIAMCLLSMIVMGYQAGLTGKRSILATWTLAITFAAVLALVTDLDRPQNRLFKMDQSLMTELQNRINQ